MGKLKGGRRKKLVREGAATTAEALTMLYCPEGHRLPNYTKNGQCTGAYCADPDSKRALSKEEKGVETALAKAEAEAPDDAESTKISLAERRLKVKLQKLGVPDTDDPAKIEEWADARMVQMLKVAVSEVEGRLRWGDDDQRWEAAQQVLSSTGRKSRESGVGGSAPIIIINGSGGGGADLPWIRRVAPIGTVDVNATGLKKK